MTPVLQKSLHSSIKLIKNKVTVPKAQGEVIRLGDINDSLMSCVV